MAMLSCENVSIAYDGKTAVRDISFEVESGDYLCIVGENGSGKSTLMKGILGLLKPTAGRFSLDGVMRKQIGYMPQQTDIQKDFPASVYEVVLSGCLNRHRFFSFYNKCDKERANENIGKLNLEPLKKTSYRNLSEGGQRRVLLARALCAVERLLLLDEPAAGLDPKMTAFMYSFLRELNKDCGVTIIMISHDLPSAVQYGNKILHMRTRPLFFGNVSEYIKTDAYAGMLGGTSNA